MDIEAAWIEAGKLYRIEKNILRRIKEQELEKIRRKSPWATADKPLSEGLCQESREALEVMPEGKRRLVETILNEMLHGPFTPIVPF
jgi:hypothetical protein